MFEADEFPEEPSDEHLETPVDAGIDPSNGLPWMPRHLGWLCGTQRERLEWLLAEPPSSDTVVAIEAIGQEPMEPAERMLYAAICEKHESAFTARSMQAQLKATRPSPGSIFNDQHLLDAELALVLRR